MSGGAGRDTIVAPATAPGRSAIAVVRIDGPDAVAIVEALAVREFEARRANRTGLGDAGAPIDDAGGGGSPAPPPHTHKPPP